MSCAFTVVDARQWDMPIVYCSETFERLTGYERGEILGRNCRFLQVPHAGITPSAGGMGEGGIRDERGKWTHEGAVNHLREFIKAGRECQASIVNYKKDGRAFINLVTIIPISWESDEIAYFVGLQVDLVEQPFSIVERMRDGTYIVNYAVTQSTIPQFPTLAQQTTVSFGTEVHAAQWVEEEAETFNYDVSLAMSQTNPQTQSHDFLPNVPPHPSGEHEVSDDSPSNTFTSIGSGVAATGMGWNGGKKRKRSILEDSNIESMLASAVQAVESTGTGGIEVDESERGAWNEWMLDCCDDFIHVLSLKGTVLYVSPNTEQFLEYEAASLISRNWADYVHPADVVGVMRDIKDITNTGTVRLLYRVRKRTSGYIWMEARGRLDVEQSKGRKCVVLVGRIKPLDSLPWPLIRSNSSISTTRDNRDFWVKLSSTGIVLYTTAAAERLLGSSAEKFVGLCLPELDTRRHKEILSAIERTLKLGAVQSVHHTLRTGMGFDIHVRSVMFPNGRGAEAEGEVNGMRTIFCNIAEFDPSDPAAASAPSNHVFSLPSAPASSFTHHTSPHYPPFVNTEALSSATDADVFAELEVRGSTSWQYEVHNLKLQNKKLKEEYSALLSLKEKKQLRC
ncbi:hypothetical protein BT69DRAFT_1281874 [Atractiella rhizophila]|nr:hypothetical protein BT69DRAFT_1281874 [Atractiella rhizophila]